MKKLIIASIAVAVGFMANAATVDWQVWVTGGTKVANAYDGYTAYLVTASAWDALTEVTAATFTSDVILDSASFDAGGGKTTYTYKTLKTGATTAGTRSVSVSATEGDTLGVYYVLFNSNKDPSEYYTIADSLAVRSDTGEIALGSNTSIAQSSLSTGWTAVGGGSSPVPEPTSGLLLVLGMAGLALRRKRA